MSKFTDYSLALLSPKFDSELTDVIMELERLRELRLRGDTPAPIFFQLKEIFQTLESLGSARIEGNHTTLADYIETKIDQPDVENDEIHEIKNIEEALHYVEKTIKPGSDITEVFTRELHSLVVKGLQREGDPNPGGYRKREVSINMSKHIPPIHVDVPRYMEELTRFINQKHPPKYDLMKVALAHHRFTWIHPFQNGNGRVVRLLTHSQLIKYGFNVHGRVLNTTAVFCNDRDLYYDMLGQADSGKQDGLENWCIYVLNGIKGELFKLDQLTKYDWLRSKILDPAIDYGLGKKLINDIEEKILRIALDKNGIIKLRDLDQAFPDLKPHQKTYQLQKLITQKMLQPVHKGARSYMINFVSSYLMRGLIHSLTIEGFVPDPLNRP